MIATSIGIFALSLVAALHAVPVSVLIPAPVATSNGGSTPEGTNNALYISGGFEGDMMLPEGYELVDSGRGVAIFGNRQWPSGVIPYDLSAITDANDQKTITDAMNTLMYAVGTPVSGSTQRNACVYFRPRQSTDKVYIKVQYGNGCSAHVGYMTGQQPTVTLQKNGCFYSRIIQHELMHVIGFYHEQSRPDRDTYLQINLENVQSSMQHNFNKYAWGSTVTNQGSNYDYGSIMHYETTAFSMNGKPTMVPRQTGVTIGKAQALSATDIAEVRNYYSCKA